MKRQNEIVLTLFSDPMMGLAYECEPTLDRLVERYGNRIVLEYAMLHHMVDEIEILFHLIYVLMKNLHKGRNFCADLQKKCDLVSANRGLVIAVPSVNI